MKFDTPHPFPHHRLDAFKVALELAVLCNQVAADIPRGHRPLADQLLRSSSAVPLLVAEGANRLTAAQKRQRFVEARGECGETAAAVELAAALGLVNCHDAQVALALAGRVGAMLTRLIQRFGA